MNDEKIIARYSTGNKNYVVIKDPMYLEDNGPNDWRIEIYVEREGGQWWPHLFVDPITAKAYIELLTAALKEE